MKQFRLMSLVASVANVIVGYGATVLTQACLNLRKSSSEASPILVMSSAVSSNGFFDETFLASLDLHASRASCPRSGEFRLQTRSNPCRDYNLRSRRTLAARQGDGRRL